ncbi:MAG: non-homologous end-joining DNA ligase, partial [Rhizobiales bacterium]|nr:non-homologous end-joining DNA ligase [Hyphomicrobiales bacterium]
TFVAPQLALLEDRPPEGSGWIHEIKYDGYRLIAAISPDRVKLYTRSGLDWTEKFSSLVPALQKLNVTALLDGEAIVQDEKGLSRFGLLQQALSDGDQSAIRYVIFDLISLDGDDLRALPLIERKAILKTLMKKARPPLLYSDHLSGDAKTAYGEACRLNLEGLVSKRKDAPYVSRRDNSWIKSKCLGRSEFVIGGYRPSDKAGRAFASLLLGEFTPKGLVYRGRVGTGFDGRLLADLGKKLKSRRIADSPFTAVPRDISSAARWVKPDLVAEIAYTELTGDGHLRHPAFIALREDKKASEVTGADRGGAT